MDDFIDYFEQSDALAALPLLDEEFDEDMHLIEEWDFISEDAHPVFAGKT